MREALYKTLLIVVALIFVFKPHLRAEAVCMTMFILVILSQPRPILPALHPTLNYLRA